MSASFAIPDKTLPARATVSNVRRQAVQSNITVDKISKI